MPLVGEHGRSVEKHKRVAESYRTELDTTQEQLAELSKVDVKALQQQLGDLQNKKQRIIADPLSFKMLV